MKSTHLIKLFLFFIASNFAIGQTLKVTKASVTFKIKNAGVTVDGSFGGFIGNVQFNPSELAKSQIEASVDVRLISTGINLRDSHLKKDEYFHAEKFPQINIKSISLSKEPAGGYSGMFSVSMKGTTKEIKIPFTYTEQSGVGKFTATFVVNRRDFKVGGSSWTMADEATVTVIIETTR